MEVAHLGQRDRLGRDLLGSDPTAPARPALLDAFLDGFARGSGTTLTPDALLPHTAAVAATLLVDIRRALDVPPDELADPREADWLPDLDARLRAHAATQRTTLLTATAALT